MTSQSVGVQGVVTATAAAITIAPSVVDNANVLYLGSNDLALQYYQFTDGGWYIFGADDNLPQAWNTEGAGLSLGGSTWIVATASVPEPGTVTLACLALLASPWPVGRGDTAGSHLALNSSLKESSPPKLLDGS